MRSGRYHFMVWIEVDPDAEEELGAWLDSVHIPEVVKKGGFLEGRRLVVKDGEGHGKFVNEYIAKDEASIRRYLEGPSKELRDDYLRHFGERSRLSRVVLEEAFSVEG